MWHPGAEVWGDSPKVVAFLRLWELRTRLCDVPPWLLCLDSLSKVLGSFVRLKRLTFGRSRPYQRYFGSSPQLLMMLTDKAWLILAVRTGVPPDHTSDDRGGILLGGQGM